MVAIDELRILAETSEVFRGADLDEAYVVPVGPEDLRAVSDFVATRSSSTTPTKIEFPAGYDRSEIVDGEWRYFCSFERRAGKIWDAWFREDPDRVDALLRAHVFLDLGKDVDDLLVLWYYCESLFLF